MSVKLPCSSIIQGLPNAFVCLLQRCLQPPRIVFILLKEFNILLRLFQAIITLLKASCFIVAALYYCMRHCCNYFRPITKLWTASNGRHILSPVHASYIEHSACVIYWSQCMRHILSQCLRYILSPVHASYIDPNAWVIYSSPCMRHILMSMHSLYM